MYYAPFWFLAERKPLWARKSVYVQKMHSHHQTRDQVPELQWIQSLWPFPVDVAVSSLTLFPPFQRRIVDDVWSGKICCSKNGKAYRRERGGEKGFTVALYWMIDVGNVVRRPKTLKAKNTRVAMWYIKSYKYFLVNEAIERRGVGMGSFQVDGGPLQRPRAPDPTFSDPPFAQFTFWCLTVPLSIHLWKKLCNPFLLFTIVSMAQLFPSLTCLIWGI